MRLLTILLTHTCRNLVIGHFINGLDTDDVPSKVLVLKPLYQLTFGLTWTKDENRLRVADMSNYFIVVFAEMAGKSPVTLILSLDLLRHTGVSDMLSHIRSDLRNHFRLMRNTHDHGLPVVDPQSHLFMHHYSFTRFQPVSRFTTTTITAIASRGVNEANGSTPSPLHCFAVPRSAINPLPCRVNGGQQRGVFRGQRAPIQRDTLGMQTL